MPDAWTPGGPRWRQYVEACATCPPLFTAGDLAEASGCERKAASAWLRAALAAGEVRRAAWGVYALPDAADVVCPCCGRSPNKRPRRKLMADAMWLSAATACPETFNRAQLALRCGRSQSQASTWLGEAVRRGIVDRVAHGRYRLAAVEQAEAAE